MRIYTINDYYCIDLAKIVSIRQFINSLKRRDRNGNKVYDYWIEVVIDSGAAINIDCQSIEEMQDTYQMLLCAWQTFVGDQTVANKQQEQLRSQQQFQQEQSQPQMEQFQQQGQPQQVQRRVVRHETNSPVFEYEPEEDLEELPFLKNYRNQ